MLQRGRKKSTLSVVTPLPGQRVEPPAYLTKDQRKVWKAVAATKPLDWFTADSHPLLANYCRHVCSADVLSQQIDAINVAELTDKAALAHLGKLLMMRAAETKAVMLLATAMRLTQHSRLKAETAHTAHTNVGSTASGGKPWDVVA